MRWQAAASNPARRKAAVILARWLVAALLAAGLQAAGLPAAGFPAAALALSGDTTGDGVVDLQDPLALCRFLRGTLPVLPAPDNADVNFDGAIDDADLRLVLRAVLGEPLPVTRLAAAPAALDFGAVRVGSDATLRVVVTNSGDMPVTIQSIALGGGTSGAFSIGESPATPALLPAGGAFPVAVRYAPADAARDLGDLAILTTGADVTVPLSGTGLMARLSVAPLVLDFGPVVAGGEALLDATIENTGNTALVVSSIATGPGTSPDFTIASSPATPFSQDPGGRAAVTVRYAPADGGDDEGSVEVVSAAGTARVVLSGRGLMPRLLVTPGSLDFGNVLTGDSAVLSIEVANGGTAPLRLTGIAMEIGTDPAFSLAASPALPRVLAPGEGQAVDVRYAPAMVGDDFGRLAITSDAGEVFVPLAGRGVDRHIMVSPGALDFGNVLVGGTAADSVEIINAGTASLSITSIGLRAGGSPDLALLNVPSLPLALAPGGRASVAVAYAPAEVGADSAVLEIRSDDPATPRVEVAISGNGVLPALTLEPNHLSFGNVRTGRSEVLRFTIRNTGLAVLSVDTLALEPSGSPDFALDGPPALPFSLDPGGEQLIAVRYAPAAPGADAGAVLIGTPAGPGRVELAGNGVAPEIDVAPLALDFGDVRTGRSASLFLTIANPGSDTLLVTALGFGAGDSPFSLRSAPSLPLPVPPQGEVILEVVFAPAGNGPAAGSLTIASDDDDEPVTLVALSGNGVSPVLEASPAAIDFGDVAVGGSADRSLTLRNAGTAGLTITDVSLAAGSSPDFTLGVPAGPLLPPGGTIVVTVTFTPAGGAASGTIAVVSDGGSASIPLSGRGVTGTQVIGVAIDRATATLAVDTCLQLRATATFSNATTGDVTAAATWQSLAPATAGAALGLVRALDPGAVTVSVSFGGFGATAEITVVPAGTLRLALPCGPVDAGATIDADLIVDTGALPLGAYAVRVTFDPAVLSLTAVAGGGEPAFSSAPGFDPASFATGATIVAAYQAASLDGPRGALRVARLSFLVNGAPGSVTTIGLEALTLAATDLSDIGWTQVPALVQVGP